jgi:Zn-finger protein
MRFLLLVSFLAMGYGLEARSALQEGNAQKMHRIGSLDGVRRRYPLASQCGNCHPEQFREWEASFHARSLSAEGFLKGFSRYMTSMEKQGRRDRDVYMACFSCHAPLLKEVEDEVVREVADLVLARQVYELKGLEVGCVACHGGEGGVFYGPIKDPAANPFHGSAYSPVYKSAAVCAGCHAWIPPVVACSAVHTDWERSQAAREGKTCQSCHMAERVGVAGTGGPSRPIHSHGFPGGRSAALLEGSVELGLSAGFDYDQLKIVVSIKNLAAHYLPDG